MECFNVPLVKFANSLMFNDAIAISTSPVAFTFPSLTTVILNTSSSPTIIDEFTLICKDGLYLITSNASLPLASV